MRPRQTRIVTTLLVALLSLIAVPAWAGVELTLSGGERLVASDIEYDRVEGIYVIELLSGDLLPLPAELVASVKLTGGDAPAPSGINVAVPRTLVGAVEPVLPRPSEQLQVFEGSRSSFRRSIISPFWQPTSDWDMSPANNNFNPARWFKEPIDFDWAPSSGFTADGDVTEFSPARWYVAPINFEWVPEDGFAPR